MLDLSSSKWKAQGSTVEAEIKESSVKICEIEDKDFRGKFTNEYVIDLHCLTNKLIALNK